MPFNSKNSARALLSPQNIEENDGETTFVTESDIDWDKSD